MWMAMGWNQFIKKKSEPKIHYSYKWERLLEETYNLKALAHFSKQITVWHRTSSQVYIFRFTGGLNEQ